MKRFCFMLVALAIAANSMAGEVYNNAVKVTFLSWVTGSTKISYERVLPNKQTAEFCTSLIGAGYDKFQNDPLGFTMRYAHKFFVGDNYGGGLTGTYVRPEVIYSHYNYNAQDVLQMRMQARMCAVLATAGYQINFNRFLIDAWAGAGYAFGLPAETGYHHGFALWRSDNVALSFSIRLGYCF